MVAINYPAYPGSVDVGGIFDATDQGYKAGKDWRYDKEQPGLMLSSLEQQMRSLQQPKPPSQAQFYANLGPNGGQVQRADLPPVTDPNSARVQQAFTSQGPGSSANTLSGNQIAGRFIKTVRDGGVTNPFALAAIAATGKAESGFDPKNAFSTWADPSQSGQAGTAGGIMSWRGPRLQAMQAFAQQNGDDPRAPSPETQAKFLLQEDPSLMQKLQAAQTSEEAAQIMANAWKFAGFNQQGGEAAQRVAATQAYAPQFGAGQVQDGFPGAAPSQQALEGLAVGQSAPMPQGVPQQAYGAPVGGSMAQGSASQAPDGGLGPGMPDPATLKALFANPLTRPYAINLAQSRIAAMQDQRDPMKQLAYQKSLLEIQNLQNPQQKPTSDMQEYQLARSQGFNGTFQDYMIGMKQAGRPQTNVNVGSEKGFDKTVGEGYGKRFLDIQDTGQSAQRALNSLDVMEQSMSDPGFYSGAGGEAVEALKRYGAALGLPGANGIDSIETFNAMSKQAALDSMGGSLGSGFSNADRDFVEGQVPTIRNTPQGNRALVDVQRKLNQRKLQIAGLARQYAAKHDGRIDAGFDDYLSNWAEANPLFPPPPKGSGSSRGAGGSNGRQRATNPKTGEAVEWDGQKWSPVQ